MKKLSLWLLGSMMLAACGGGGLEGADQSIEYLPFKAQSKGDWGMMGVDGKVLFEDKFSNEPTMARNGRFMVKNDEGLWEIYTAEAAPKHVGEAYTAICPFKEKVTLAIKPGECIKLIDTDGKEVALLDQIDGKKVIRANAFSEGIAVYRTSDYTYGAIDVNGKGVIPAEYDMLGDCSDGKLVGAKRDIVSILGKDGKVISEFNKSDYAGFVTCFVDGLLAVLVEEDGDPKIGFINEQCEWVMEPVEGIDDVKGIRNKHFIYKKGLGCGLMDFNGNVVIEPQYRKLTFMSDNLLQAYTMAGVVPIFKLYNIEGEELGETYRSLDTRYYSSGYTIAVFEDKKYGFIDASGNKVPMDTEVADFGFNDGCESVPQY
ncbi:MAG: WG repeat-containing protein [Paraprevotella sp.]|nr:WG repeat-containing protein [Paraprevotella sp.]